VAIAYVGAWIFNLLVVILPRLHDRDRILEGAGKVIERLCAVGLRAIRELGLNPEDFEDLADANQLGIFGLRLRDLLLTEESSLMTWSGDGIRPANWHGWTVHMALKAEDLYQLLIPYFPYFDGELIRLVNKVALSSFVDQGKELAGVRVTGGDMGAVADPLAEFITACRELRTYYDTQVLGKASPPDDGIAGQIAAVR
jgi:hypothetical protein